MRLRAFNRQGGFDNLGDTVEELRRILYSNQLAGSYRNVHFSYARDSRRPAAIESFAIVKPSTLAVAKDNNFELTSSGYRIKVPTEG